MTQMCLLFEIMAHSLLQQIILKRKNLFKIMKDLNFKKFFLNSHPKNFVRQNPSILKRPG